MGVLRIDLVSIVFVLAVINLVAPAFVVVHIQLTKASSNLGYFILAKLFQGLSWALRIHDFLGGGPWASALADLALLAGFTLESALLVDFTGKFSPRGKAVYGGVFLVLAGTALWTGGFSPALRNLVVFVGFLGLLWYAAVRLFRASDAGAFQKFLSVLYGILPASQAIFYVALGNEVSGPGLSTSPGALVYYGLLITLQIVGSLGYLLMVMERDSTLLLDQATHDSLTGVLNRRAFYDRAEALVSNAARRGEPLSFIVADLDHFKQINDQNGHLTGDRVLRLFCLAVGGTVRQGDLFGRNGGDEFALCLPATSRQTALTVADRIRKNLKALDPGPGTPLPVFTVSLGVGTGIPRSATDIQSLLTAADTALYTAKHRGRDRAEWAEWKPSTEGP